MSASVVPFDAVDRQKRRARRRGGDGDGPPPSGPGGPPEATDAASCPVQPLGHADGLYWFFDVAGQLRALTAQQLGQSPQLVALFGGDTRWLDASFPQLDREGNPTGWFSVRAAGRFLVAECTRVGLFRAEEPRRGIGVWLSDGVPVLHLGDRVLWLTEPRGERRAGFRGVGALWPAQPRVVPPAEPAAAKDAERLEALFARWRWARGDAGASVFFGLWAAHLLGAAIRWRPHGLVVGPAGSGKTTLFEFYGAASPLAVYLNDFTEAGLRQSLTGRAAPLLLDEAEGDAEGVHRLQRVVELLRRASGGQGAQSVRGSAGGQSQRFEIYSPALLGAILPPELLPQDASRITRLDLLPRAPDGQPLPGPSDIAWVREVAPALWGRALAGLPRFAANLEALRRDLLGRGCAPRLADQVGTILAARAMMVRDAPLSDLEAADEVDAFAWLAPSESAQAADGGPQAALTHLLQSPADLTWSGERPTIGRLVALGRGPEGDTARRALAEHGLLVAPWPRKSGGPPCLYVADRHPRLARVFEGTQWAGHRWKEDLRRLEGAVVPEDPVWIGKAKPRCTVIPAPHLPQETDGGAEGAS